ncbi:MAG: N-6 DNA methylase, partial [Deltaproteobacteria bacterium]|nr:N-6 DNA methylase [Deltaproteobacteria bacterium]
METLGQKIRSLRLGKGLSIKKLSAILKINYTYISHIERDKSIPSESLLKKIAKKLSADEEELKILSGKIPEDIKTILYKYPREAPMLIRDALGSYEALKQLSFLEDKKKHLEQFFTPLDIASGMLELIGVAKCNHNAGIIDPSCGDGVFLKAAKERADLLKIFGCDIDSEHINSIKSQIPEGSLISGNALEALLKQEGSFDFEVGNPPFSAQDNLITDKDILNNYYLGSGKKRQAIEILFFELFVRLLKRGGKFSIILPEGILSARPHKYVRDWLASN